MSSLLQGLGKASLAGALRILFQLVDIIPRDSNFRNIVEVVSFARETALRPGPGGASLWSCSGQPRGLLSSSHDLHRGFLAVDGLAFGLATGALLDIEERGVPCKRESSDVKGSLSRDTEGLQKSSLCDNRAKNRERGRDI